MASDTEANAVIFGVTEDGKVRRLLFLIQQGWSFF